jgi:hypothetical protein
VKDLTLPKKKSEIESGVLSLLRTNLQRTESLPQVLLPKVPHIPTCHPVDQVLITMDPLGTLPVFKLEQPAFTQKFFISIAFFGGKMGARE